MAQPARQMDVIEDIDPFMESMNKLLAWAKARQKQLIVWAVVLIVLIAALAGAAYFYNRAQNRAAIALGKAMDAYAAARASNSPFSAYGVIEGEFKKIMDKYGYTDSADIALMQYASVCSFSGDYDKAVDAYKKALDKHGDDPMLRDLLESGLAFSYLGKKDYKKAASWFEKITKEPDAIGKDEAYFNLGLIYAKSGQNKKSMEAFKKIVADFPGSIYLEAAKLRIAG